MKCQIASAKIHYMELYRGRYLALGGPAAFLVYDLSTQREIFGHIEAKETFRYWCRRSGSVDDDYDADFYIPVGKVIPASDCLNLYVITNPCFCH